MFLANNSLKEELCFLSSEVKLPLHNNRSNLENVKPPYPDPLASVKTICEVTGLKVQPFRDLIFCNQNVNSSIVPSVSDKGWNHDMRRSI